MKRLSLISRTLLGGFLALALTTTSYGQTTGQTADVPKTISYQGLISTPDGGAIADGSYEITVTIYGDVEGKSVVWRNSYTTDVRGGLFNLYLGGEESPLPGAGALNRPLWVGTQVAGSGELRPLTPLSASPYALNVADKAVTSDKVDMDYVSEIRIDGEKVTGKGTVLNLESDENISLKYDAVTGSVKIGSVTAATGTRDGEKGARTQATPDSWNSGGDLVTPAGVPLLAVATDWIGTGSGGAVTPPIPFNIKVNNAMVMRYAQNTAGVGTVNVIGGDGTNAMPLATSTGSVIAGGGSAGAANFIHGNYDVISGGDNNVIGTVSNNFDYSTISGGNNNSIQNDFATVGGGQTNTVNNDWGTIGGGDNNTVSGNYGTISGGASNGVSIDFGTVGGGNGNNVGALAATVGGGSGNNVNAPGDHGTIAGGEINMVNGLHGTVGGGMNNHANAEGDVVAGGQDNHIHFPFGFVGGGRNNHINADYGVISGGQDNHIAPMGLNGTIGGGMANMLDAGRATIGGGEANHVVGSGDFSTIAGGQANHIDVPHATVGGGEANNIVAGGTYGTISGGVANHIDVQHGTIGGGEANSINAAGAYGTIAGGSANAVDVQHGTIGGGEGNQVLAAAYGTIPGGDNLQVLNGYGQTAVGFFNDPWGGAVAPRPAPLVLTDDPLFMVGNGDYNAGTPVRSNAFEVSYNGHSVVSDVNGTGGATGPGRYAIPGATYVDNIIYAWGNVPATPGVFVPVIPNSDFGVSAITKGAAAGEYLVQLNIVDPTSGLMVVLNNASITATLVEDPSYTCGTITTSDLGAPGLAPNQFRIRTFDLSTGSCTSDALPFMFKVTGRP